jgi:hypothetical protein
MAMDPTQLAALAKAAPEVVKEAYGDLASDSFKQVGKLGEDIIKTVRLVLFPIQLAAAVQDRLGGYINRAIRQVPESKLIAPTESIMFPVAEKLRFQEENNPVTDLYINLLSRAMDGERVGEAHPAFVAIISQLAPDEVVFLKELSRNEFTIIIKLNDEWSCPTPEQVKGVFEVLDVPHNLQEKSISIVFKYASLNQPELFRVFLEHLNHL